MGEATVMVAEARIPLPRPQAMLDLLCEHFVEHGEVSRHEGGGRIESRFGIAHLTSEADALAIRAECPDRVSLSVVKSALAEHVARFAGGAAPAFTWTGADAGLAAIPYFQAAQVVSARQVTPRMRRVTVSVADASRYAGGGLHVRVLIPPRGRAAVWPAALSDGRIAWPEGEDELTARVYTIRAIDHATSTLDIDVVLHGDDHSPGSGPGSIWAGRAAPGDAVGLMGPGGGSVAAAATLVLLGDETALPAIARILAECREGQRAIVRIEVADAAEIQPLPSRGEVDVRFLERGGAAPGTTCLLVDAATALDWAALGRNTAVLCGCEHRAAKRLRGLLREGDTMPRENILVAAYWRRSS